MAKKRENLKAEENKAPIGVKIIAWCYYVCAVCSIVISLLLLIGIFWNEFFYQGLLLLITPIINNLLLMLILTPSLSIYGILYLIWAVLSFFIGRGLFRLKKWARNVSIICSVVGFVTTIWLAIGYIFLPFISWHWGRTFFEFVYLIPSMIVYLAIAIYLLFSKKVKEAFNY